MMDYFIERPGVFAGRALKVDPLLLFESSNGHPAGVWIASEMRILSCKFPAATTNKPINLV